MQGYLLKEGEYTSEKLSESQMWDAFDWLFSSKSRNDSSYKFLFLKSILDNIENCDEKGYISFDALFANFTRTAWNLVAKYEILQKRKASGKKATYLEQIIQETISMDCSYACFDKIEDGLRTKIIKKIKNECKKYVVGALYGDMKAYLYSFSKAGEWICLNPQMKNFINVHKSVIESLNYYKWATFYEEINDGNTHRRVCEMIDKSFVRKNESIYRAVLAYEYEYIEQVQDVYERVNTLELLFDADNSIEDETIDDSMVEKELFVDINNMKEYLDDPILLITKLKKEKGIMI